MRTLDNINKFLVEKLGQKAQPTLLDAFNALSRAYGGEGKARSKEKALEELAIVFVGPAEGVQLKAGPITTSSPKLIELISFADLKKLDTAAITSMRNMFYICSGLTSLDLSNFDTSKVTSMYSMFSNCSALTSVKWPGEGKWASNAPIGTFDISAAPLDVASIQGLVTALATKTSQCSLKLKSANWEAAKAADSTLETTLEAKNWVVTAV